MPINHADIALLNNSMQNMGNSFRQSRLDTEATTQRTLDNSIRERMLKNQETREARADEGITEAGLQGDDGVVVGYRGSPTGLQKMVDDAKKQGRTLKVVPKPQKQASIGTFTTSTPYGDVTLHINSEDDVPKLTAFAQKIGGARKQSPGFNTRVGHDTKLITDLESAVAAATTPEAKAKAERELAVAKQLAGLDKATDSATITEDYPAVDIPADVTPAVPEKRNWFSPNIPAKPAVTNAPAINTPARKVTRKATPEEIEALRKAVPGTPAPAPAASAAAMQPAPRNPSERVKNQVYDTPRGPMTWTGTGWLPAQ